MLDERSIRSTIVFKLCGQAAIGPSGVDAQSNARMCAAISVSLWGQSVWATVMEQPDNPYLGRQRYSPGFTPVHFRNARKNELASENPAASATMARLRPVVRRR